ncbi:MAG: methyltransferase [Spirochaetaceae bacterium]|nr:MAG: methyltransferase [Spirochaetaceae bacterium]
MTSRQRVQLALDHEEPDRVPVDLGSSLVTGIQASAYARLKRALGIGEGEVRVYEPFQMLAEVEEPVRRALGVDVYGIMLPVTIFGYRNENWKAFRLFDGTEVRVSQHFVWDELPNGDLVQYPQGDRGAPASGRMPKDGFYFDAIVRQEPIDETRLDAREWVEQTYGLFGDEDLRFLEEQSRWYFENSEYALFGNFGGGSFGDIAIVVGPHIPHPKGIRDPEEFYVSHLTRKEYIREIFELTLEIQMKNIEMYWQAVGERIQVIEINGNDFGAQNGPFISPQMYRELYKPYHKRMNDWVHANTGWKTFFHSCGSNVAFLDDFREAGVDILNPVQISATGMDPGYLKKNYGDDFVFWGGAVDAQHTLPFASADQVRREVRENVRTFMTGGGFVFNNVHNIQAGVPVDNILAMFQALQETGHYGR